MDSPAPSTPQPTIGERPVPVRLARLSGALAALVALVTAEVVSAFGDPPQSLVASVGTSVIDRFAGALKDIAVQLFGTNDKAALLIGIVVIAVVVGAMVGPVTVRRPWIGPAVIAGFGLIGVFASFADPQADKALAVVAAGLGTAAGIFTLWGLLRLAGRPVAAPAVDVAGTPVVSEDPRHPYASRRAFFGWAGAAGAFVVVVGAAAQKLGTPSRAEQARAAVRLPSLGTPPAPTNSGAALDVPGLTPYYVPNADFYRIDTALIVPQVDPATWRLRVTGMVDRPFELTFDELLGLPQVEEAVTLSCVSNAVGGDLVGNARWQGVPLRALLDRAGVQPGATQLVGISTDGFTAGFPTAALRDDRVALVAIGMNGEPLPIRHGFPARLVISGLYGYVSATKWLQEIRLTRWEDFDGYWIDKGWSKEAPVKTQSRIDVPRPSTSLAEGKTRIAGVAWAPTRGIAKVEVQVDDGPWTPALLGGVASDDTWVQWVVDWDASAGDHLLRCRATDGTGETQTPVETSAAPNGATGWHEVYVAVE